MRANSGIALSVLVASVVMFFSGSLFARIFPDGDSKPFSDLLIAAIGAFAGAAAGVWIGLSVDRKRREQETEDRRVEAANIAIHTLSQIYSYSRDYANQILIPLSVHPNRWYEISRSELRAPPLKPFDIDRLAFLFEGEHKNLPSRLSIDFVRYEGLLYTMRRAQQINEEIQAKARAARPFDLVSPLEYCNDATKETLSRAIDTLIDHNEKLAPSVMEVALELRSALRTMYPGRTIIKFAPPEPRPSAS
jgi:hypothetical protein